MAGSRRLRRFFFVITFNFVIVVIIIIVIIVVRVVFFLVIFIIVFRDDVEMDGMRLNDFQLGFTLDASYDFAFFHFVFVEINFYATLWAMNHGQRPP
jgi:hypothetical protein